MTNELLKDSIQWDIKTWSKALIYWENNIDWDKIHNGLELGANQGGISLWLALKGKTIVCSDLEDTKIKAEPLHAKYHVQSFVKYQDIDASNIPYENYFDLIVFKSLITSVGRGDNYEIQAKIFNEIYKALKPGGKFLFAENLKASPFHQFLRKMFVPWGNDLRYISLKEMKVFLKDFSFYNLKTTGVLGTFGRKESQKHLLSRLDEIIFNNIMPANGKYLVYGIAEK